jgi:hypothetical protein
MHTINRNTAFREAIERFRPVLAIFGINGAQPVSSLDGLAMAVIASDQVPDEYQPALRAHVAIDENAFSELYARWLVRDQKRRAGLADPAFFPQSPPMAAIVRHPPGRRKLEQEVV